MGDPSGTHHQEAATSSFYGAHAPGSSSVPENLSLSSEWSAEEQSILEDNLLKYVSESSINLYAKIALHLPNKTIRDVALRCKWLSGKDNNKRRKEENIARKNRDKKEKAIDSSGRSLPYTSQLNVFSYSNSIFPAKFGDGISDKAMGGWTVKLLEQNAHAFSQISSNLSTMQTQENIDLLRQTRDNILHIVNSFNDMSEITRRMPPLPVMLNEELASTIIPPNLPRSSSNWPFRACKS